LEELARLARNRLRVVSWFALDPRVHVRLVPYLHSRLVPRADATIFTAWQTVVDFRGPYPPNSTHLVYDYEFWRTRPELRPAIAAALTTPGLRRVAGSRAVERMLEEAGTRAAATVPCGVDLEQWRSTDAPASSPPLVGFPLRNEAHKGMSEAFAAAELVRHQMPGTRFAAFGTADASPPAFVDTRGFLSNDALRDFYNECTVFLLPSRFEGWGLPAAEAMACGTPVVTTANGGAEDFAVDEETALVIPPGDTTAIADAVCRLLRDPKLRRAIAAAGHRRASQMTWDAATDALLRALHG
jgi:glycosyltransferase involved in cell wall biosynthesis